MKNSQKIALSLAVVLVMSCTKPAEKPAGAPPPTPTAATATTPTLTEPRDANAGELAVVAPLVKGGKLLNYTVTDIKMTPKEGLAVALRKAGGFLPDGGPTDGGSCDPSHPDEALAYLTVWLASDGGTPSRVRGPVAIITRPVNMPQSEVDRLAAAFADIIAANVNVPVPPALADGNKQAN